MIHPFLTTATQVSGGPFPLPILVSAGKMGYGTDKVGDMVAACVSA